MFRFKIVFVVSLLSLICLYAFCKPTYPFLKDRTVYIKGTYTESISEDGKKVQGAWAGTGVVYTIKDGYTYILTNAHVAGDDRKDVTLYVEDSDGFKEASLVKFYSGADLAIIKIVGTLDGKSQISTVRMTIPIQENVYVVGHHLGRKYVYGEGVMAGREEYGNCLIIQVPCAFGNSGSGVFDDDGNLVGLVFAISRVGMFGVDVAHALVVDGVSIVTFIESIPEIHGTLNYR